MGQLRQELVNVTRIVKMLKTHFVLGARSVLHGLINLLRGSGTHATAARDQVSAARLQLLPNAPFSTETLYPRILVFLKNRFKACVSNAFGEIFLDPYR